MVKLARLKQPKKAEAGSTPARPVRLAKLTADAAQPGKESCHRGCEVCEGFRVKGNWHHSVKPWCPRLAVLWNYVLEEYPGDLAWQCPHGCEPQALASGVTHNWRCPFWNEHDATPFD